MSAPPIELRADSARALIAPDRGGRPASLTIDGREFLADEGPRAGDQDWFGGSFLMAPWAGRTAEGQHGLVYDAAWPVVTATETELLLAVDVRHPVWSGRIEQRFTLHPDRFETAVTATPVAAGRCVLGLHPWFVREDDGSLPEIDAAFASRLTADGLAALPDAGLGVFPRDEIYRDADRAPVLRWRDGRSLTVRSEAPVWVVYEQDPLGFCVEPWTGTPGDFDAGRVTASPADPARLSMTLAWA